jgi:hypothetical protein
MLRGSDRRTYRQFGAGYSIPTGPGSPGFEFRCRSTSRFSDSGHHSTNAALSSFHGPMFSTNET